MVRRTKIALVLGGYALAVVAAVVAGWLYDAWAARQTFDTSGGMYAGGQLLQALGAFLLVALAPTALALWFLRGNELFWNAVAVAALAFAATGLVAVLVPQASPRTVPLMLFDLLGLAQLLGVPLWLAAFALFARLAPSARARRTLTLAVACEAVIGVCAAVHWFVPRA
jgi:hypothetical protein